MKQAVPYFGRFLSKLVLEIIPGALVSVFAAYLLSMLHLGAEPATSPPQNVTAVQNDGLSGDERRELTRQMLKERRENPEEPAEVKPVPSLRPAALPSETADLGAVPHDNVAAPPAAAESKLHPEPEAKPHAEPRPSSVATIAPPPTTPLPRPPAPRAKTEAAAPQALTLAPPFAAPATAAPTVTASLPPPVTVAPGAVPPQGAPTQLPQVTVNAPSNNAPSNAPAGDLATQPQQRGIVGNIFSGVSTIAGGAANITGNTVNWVIDLPGKAISAGGKLLTGNGSTPAAAPGNAAGPAGANATAGNGSAPGSAAPAAAPPPAPLPMIDPQRRNFL
jgi:hypothetical protein